MPSNVRAFTRQNSALRFAWAKQLELSEVQELLEATLIEEENTDELLSELAEDAINPAAAEA